MGFLPSAEGRISVDDQVLVSVGDFQAPDNEFWARNTCAQVHSLFNQVSTTGASIHCRKYDANKFRDTFLEQNPNRYRYHLRINRTFDNRYLVEATNLLRVHQTDFTVISWALSDGQQTGVTKEKALAKVLSNFFYFISNEQEFKSVLLEYGSQVSTQIEKDAITGKFQNRKSKKFYTDFEAYQIFERESVPQANYLRTGLEIGAAMSAGLILHSQNFASLRDDHDYQLSGIYYQLARTSGFGALESFLISFATSAAWELLEYREVFSLNDLILTPIVGYVMGEATYQITCALLKKTLGGRITGFVKSQPDCAKSRWSEISIFLGKESGRKLKKTDGSEQSLTFGIEAEVIPIENYGNPGQASRFVFDTSLAKAFLEKSGDGDSGDLKVVAQILAAAYYQKDLERDQWGQLQGYDMLVGVGSATTWHDIASKGKASKEDFYGTINVIGASARAQFYFKGTKLRLEIGFYGDFAMVKAWSMSDFDSESVSQKAGQASDSQTKGYYWGVGTSTLSAITWDLERFKIGYKAQFSDSANTKSMHRFQQSVAAQADFKDSFILHEVSVTLKISKSVYFTALREVIHRRGSYAGHASLKGKYDRTVGKLVYLF